MIARALAMILLTAGGWVAAAYAWAWTLRVTLRLLQRYYR